MNRAKLFGSRGAIIFWFVCLLMTACASNTLDPSNPGNSQWFSCRADKLGTGWDCSENGQPVTGTAANQSIETETSSDEKGTLPEASDSQMSSVTQETIPYQQIGERPPQPAPPMPDSQVESQTGSNYSVQLAAFSSQEQRERYLSNIPAAREDLILVEEQRDGQTWWLVLYGNYEGYSDALNAEEYLNESLGIQDTWVKPLN